MKTVLHTADTRGRAEHGWLDSRHTFSFADYYDLDRMGFGVLRVINDDIVGPGAGFGTHAHHNMEIISIPLRGSLRHEDSMGNVQVIRQGEVQIMSAGTGITHSEYNASDTDPVNFLQIWVLPKLRDIAPRYSQQEFPAESRQDRFQAVVARDSEDGAVGINQDAWFSLGDFSVGHREPYRLHTDENGVYVFVLEGEVEVAGEHMGRRDGMGITEFREVEIVAAAADCQLLVMEVPL
jgi:redox-sensitive bicupin YhaK (pirin superfamily)